MNIAALEGRIQLMTKELSEMINHVREATENMHRLQGQLSEATHWRNSMLETFKNDVALKKEGDKAKEN